MNDTKSKITVKRVSAGDYTWSCGPFTGYMYKSYCEGPPTWDVGCGQEWHGTTSPHDEAVDAFGMFDPSETMRDAKSDVERVVRDYFRAMETSI